VPNLGVLMSVFTDRERGFLRSTRALARIATVGVDGTPHVVPTGWTFNLELDVIDIGGRNLTATKKYRDAARSGRVAIVVDEVLPPWQPRGVEIRGRAETLDAPAPLIRLHPERIISWGLESEAIGERYARSVR
jgi:pyridoxamine 5'-phosphate oxidase family protein